MELMFGIFGELVHGLGLRLGTAGGVGVSSFEIVGGDQRQWVR